MFPGPKTDFEREHYLSVMRFDISFSNNFIRIIFWQSSEGKEQISSHRWQRSMGFMSQVIWFFKYIWLIKHLGISPFINWLIPGCQCFHAIKNVNDYNCPPFSPTEETCSHLYFNRLIMFFVFFYLIKWKWFKWCYLLLLDIQLDWSKMYTCLFIVTVIDLGTVGHWHCISKFLRQCVYLKWKRSQKVAAFSDSSKEVTFLVMIWSVSLFRISCRE